MDNFIMIWYDFSYDISHDWCIYIFYTLPMSLSVLVNIIEIQEQWYKGLLSTLIFSTFTNVDMVLLTFDRRLFHVRCSTNPGVCNYKNMILSATQLITLSWMLKKNPNTKFLRSTCESNTLTYTFNRSF